MTPVFYASIIVGRKQPLRKECTMPDEEKDICPECGNPNCVVCFAFGFGVPDNEAKKSSVPSKEGKAERQTIPDKYDLC